MSDSKVVVTYWPRRYNHFSFGDNFPKDFADMMVTHAPMDSHTFPGLTSDEKVLDLAFEHWNYVNTSLQAPEVLNERASILYIGVSANAGDIFSVSDSLSTRWWYCCSSGWQLLTLK